jgi:hypothetical protein
MKTEKSIVRTVEDLVSQEEGLCSLTVTEHEQRAAEEICRSIYEETKTFYEHKAPRVAGEDLGYRILYGPPVVRAEYLFLGYQPGGGADSKCPVQLQRWPTECEYALNPPGLRNAGWKNPKLALNMQKLWGVPVLKKSTGLNAIFFRAPDLKKWRQLESGLRKEIEDFSLERASRIIKTLRPKYLVVIGLQTFDLLATSETLALERDGKCLIKQGVILGMAAFGVIHLSGAYVSKNHFNAIKAYFGERT